MQQNLNEKVSMYQKVKKKKDIQLYHEIEIIWNWKSYQEMEMNSVWHI